MPALIEAVPNFSEGRDPERIRQIVARIAAVAGVTVLNVDPGKATNRTVVTFVGEPAAVVEAAVQADPGRRRTDRHATPLGRTPPHRGDRRLPPGTDLGDLDGGVRRGRAPSWGSGSAGSWPSHLSLRGRATRPTTTQPRGRAGRGVRRACQEDPGAGLEAGLRARRADPPHGATVVGARDFLVAYNVNLNTTSTRRANAIAFDVREAGRPRRTGHPLTGPIERDADGQPVSIPGSLQAVKAIGWFIEEYGIAQISMNLTDICRSRRSTWRSTRSLPQATARGVRVTGSETRRPGAAGGHARRRAPLPAAAAALASG